MPTLMAMEVEEDITMEVSMELLPSHDNEPRSPVFCHDQAGAAVGFDESTNITSKPKYDDCKNVDSQDDTILTDNERIPVSSTKDTGVDFGMEYHLASNHDDTILDDEGRGVFTRKDNTTTYSSSRSQRCGRQIHSVNSQINQERQQSNNGERNDTGIYSRCTDSTNKSHALDHIADTIQPMTQRHQLNENNLYHTATTEFQCSYPPEQWKNMGPHQKEYKQHYERNLSSILDRNRNSLRYSCEEGGSKMDKAIWDREMNRCHELLQRLGIIKKGTVTNLQRIMSVVTKNSKFSSSSSYLNPSTKYLDEKENICPSGDDENADGNKNRVASTPNHEINTSGYKDLTTCTSATLNEDSLIYNLEMDQVNNRKIVGTHLEPKDDGTYNFPNYDSCYGVGGELMVSQKLQTQRQENEHQGSKWDDSLSEFGCGIDDGDAYRDSFNETNREFKPTNTTRHRLDSSSSSISSVEIVRSDNTQSQHSLSHASFQSPTMKMIGAHKAHKKRIASSSGKKGMDLQRMRRMNFDDGDDENIDSPSQLVCSSIQSPIDNDDKISFETECSAGNVRGIMTSPPSFLNSPLCSESPIPHRKSILTPTVDHDAAVTDHKKKIVVTKRVIQFGDDVDESAVNDFLPSEFSHESDSPQLNDNIRSKKGLGLNDTIETANCTILPRRARQLAKKSSDDCYDSHQAPSNISLRDGAYFYMDPLKVCRPPRWARPFEARSKTNISTASEKKKTKASKENAKTITTVRHPRTDPTLSNHDPFEAFGTRTAERLEVMSEWLNRRDSTAWKKLPKSGLKESQGSLSSEVNEETSLADDISESRGNAVILSVTCPQIISLALHMFLSNGIDDQRRRSSYLEKNKKNSSTNSATSISLSGGTLLVVRGKEDMPAWESALRERTAFSVFNHSEMPSTERRRSTTAAKCAAYDIVITTFDAIKTKEVATQVDHQGRAVHKKKSQDGWLSSRKNGGSLSGSISEGNSQPQMCEVLSVLHSMDWHRLVFVDVLGRQSYLTKPGTARSQAAIALKGKSRSSDENTFNEEKLKDSRRQLLPIARTLELPEDRAADLVVGEALLDLRDVTEMNEYEGVIESYSEDSSFNGDIIECTRYLNLDDNLKNRRSR